VTEYKRLGLTFLSAQPQFTIQNGEIGYQTFNAALVDAEFPKIEQILIEYLNSLEAFAIPFAAGVADDGLGFQETARAFCQGAQLVMPGIFQMRIKNIARFESTVKLFALWNNRLAAEAFAPLMKGMEEVIKAAGKGKIKPIGVE
jgi:hypothetical protein